MVKHLVLFIVLSLFLVESGSANSISCNSVFLKKATIHQNLAEILTRHGVADVGFNAEANRLYQMSARFAFEDNAHSFTRGYVKIHSLINEIIESNDHRNLKPKLQSVLHLIKAIQVLNEIRMYEKTVFFHEAFLKDEWTEAFMALGMAKSVIAHSSVSESLVKNLIAMQPFLSQMADPVGSKFLEALSTDFFNQAKGIFDSFSRGNHFTGGFSFSFKNLPKFDANSAESLTLRTSLGSQLNSFEVKDQQKLISAMMFYKSAQSVEVLKSLSRFKWFSNQSSPDRLKIFNLLNYISFVAEHSKSPSQRSLLTNTLKLLLQGRIPILMESQEDNLGSAGVSTIYINNREEHHGAVSMSFVYMALHVVVHEVSHVLSGIRVSATPEYFEEEYRAWYVGFSAEHGRKPVVHEAAEKVAYLLTYYKGQTDKAYGYIAKSFQNNPKQYSKYFEDLGIRFDPSMVYNYHSLSKVALTSNKPNQEAPIWNCWTGCLENLPR